jgi:ribosomal protein S27AE
MTSTPRRGLGAFLPTSWSLTLTLIALGILVLGLLFSIAYGLDETRTADDGGEIRLTAGERFGNFLAPLGLFTLPAAAVLVQVGAWLEKRYVPRAGLGCLSALALALAALTAALAMTFNPGSTVEVAQAPLMTAVAFAACCVGPVILLFSIVAIRALPKAREEMHRAVWAEREERAIEFIHAHDGEATYAGLARELDISEDRVDRLLRDLLGGEKIAGVREARFGRFYTLSRCAEKQRLLLGVIASRGQVLLDDLAYELDVPRDLVKELIYALVQRGKFTGYINWHEDTIYSAEAEKLRAGERCPSCGGELGLAGKGVIHCGNCGTEVFLAGDEE